MDIFMEMSRQQYQNNWVCPLDYRHDDVIKWNHFPRYWPFVRGIHRSPVYSPHKGQSRGALTFSLIVAWINGWVNIREAGDLRRHRAHYDITVMALCREQSKVICKVALVSMWSQRNWLIPGRLGQCRGWWCHGFSYRQIISRHGIVYVTQVGCLCAEKKQLPSNL